MPLLALAGLVIGGIYAGWFTPTESGAVGALGAFVLAAARRKLTWKSLWQVLVETGQITVSIMFLIIAANIYSRLIALSGFCGSEDRARSAEAGFSVHLRKPVAPAELLRALAG